MKSNNLAKVGVIKLIDWNRIPPSEVKDTMKATKADIGSQSNYVPP